MTECRFVTNYATVLLIIARNEQMPARDISVYVPKGQEQQMAAERGPDISKRFLVMLLG